MWLHVQSKAQSRGIRTGFPRSWRATAALPWLLSILLLTRVCVACCNKLRYNKDIALQECPLLPQSTSPMQVILGVAAEAGLHRGHRSIVLITVIVVVTILVYLWRRVSRRPGNDPGDRPISTVSETSQEAPRAEPFRDWMAPARKEEEYRQCMETLRSVVSVCVCKLQDIRDSTRLVAWPLPCFVRPQAATEFPSTTDRSQQCVICMHHVASVRSLCCRQLALCPACVAGTTVHNTGIRQGCPLCRGPLEVEVVLDRITSSSDVAVPISQDV